MDMIVTLATDGSVLDTLRRFPPGGTLNLGNPNSPEINLFTAEPVWQIAEDMRLLFGINDNYRIGIYSPDGELERVITKPFELTPIGETDQDLMWTFFEEQLKLVDQLQRRLTPADDRPAATSSRSPKRKPKR